jgi:hypothetical protein
VTEVVAQVVDLRGHRGTGGATRGQGLGCTGTGGERRDGAGKKPSPFPAPAGGTGVLEWLGSSENGRMGGEKTERHKGRMTKDRVTETEQRNTRTTGVE